MPEPTPKWTYNRYRASLYKDGKIFALMTPDGKNEISPEQAEELLKDLNAGAQANTKPNE
jgi:hypothetical protein